MIAFPIPLFKPAVPTHKKNYYADNHLFIELLTFTNNQLLHAGETRSSHKWDDLR